MRSQDASVDRLEMEIFVHDIRKAFSETSLAVIKPQKLEKDRS